MLAHIKKCTNLTEAQRAAALGQGNGASEPSSSVTDSSQAKLNKFMAAKDVPYSDAEQAKFERLALCATVSANLPWQWLQNEHVRELLLFLKPSVSFPHRHKLAGQLQPCCTVHVMPVGGSI